MLVLKQPDLGTALILILITRDADIRWRTQLAHDGGLMLGAVLAAPVAGII